jgi:toxin ParE1/3/4
MGEINWTNESEQWLKDIFDFISLNNLNSAYKVIEAIYEKTQILRRFPEIGYRYNIIQERHVRILLYGHYRIAYLIKSNEDIDILGVFHGALDIEQYLY